MMSFVSKTGQCPQEDTTKHGVRKMVPEAIYSRNMVLAVSQEQHEGAALDKYSTKVVYTPPMEKYSTEVVCTPL